MRALCTCHSNRLALSTTRWSTPFPNWPLCSIQRVEFRDYFRDPKRVRQEANDMKKWAYPLLIAFVAFFIFSNPTQSGTQGRAFVVWIGDLASAAGDFLEGLFDDDADTSNNQNLQPSNSAPAVNGTNTGTGDGSGGDDTTRRSTQGGGGNEGGGGSDSFDTLAALQTG